MDAGPITDAVQLGLGVTQAQLAPLIGVDVRTVVRWHTGEAMPRGAGWAILLALRSNLIKRPERTEALRKLVAEALPQRDVLGFLLDRLLSTV